MVEVINIMADGTICEDLSTYMTPERAKALPYEVKVLIADFVREGREIREKKEKQKS